VNSCASAYTLASTATLRRSLSNGQANNISLLCHPRLLSCHSGAEFNKQSANKLRPSEPKLAGLLLSLRQALRPAVPPGWRACFSPECVRPARPVGAPVSRSTATASALIHFPHHQRHHPHTASPLNLLPPPLVNAKPPGHRLAGNTGILQLSPPGVQLPPTGRHLDQKAPIPQKVMHLPVGITAGKGPKPPRSGA
jgi:hypothetical protein